MQHSTSSAAEDFRKYQFKLISAATNLLLEYAHDAVQAHFDHGPDRANNVAFAAAIRDDG